MFEYLLKKLVELAGDSLDWARLRTWLKSLTWRMRLAILGLVGLLILGVYFWTSLPLLYLTTVSYVKAATIDPAIIPLRSSLKLKLRATAERLSEGLRPDLDDTSRINPPSAWTLAQLTAAADRTVKVDPDRIRTYLRNTEIACNCWGESPDVTSLPNVAVSGWVLFALAKLDLPATESEVRFFLTEQNKRDGWWSVFQASDDEANASTFGTAWALLGLQNQLRKKLIPEVLIDDTSDAIRKGVFSWLSRQENGSRWKDYPFHPKGTISGGLSGLAMHALSLTAPDSLAELKKEWLEHLPSEVPAASDKSQNYVWVTLRMDKSGLDSFAQITLPWLLIATADAYPAGDYSQRAKALIWLDHSLDQDSVVHAEKQPDNWWRAELLLALHILLDRSEGI